MENAAVANVLRGEGYRYCQTNLAEAGIYYKYYQEGFHIVMAVDLSGGNRFSVQQYRSMEEHAMDLFYHPQGRLGDFPDGFPVYHVEMLTLLIGGDSEVERKVCAERRNVWVYQPQSGRLLIYENQPGDFFGLRGALEQGAGTGGAEEMSRQGTGAGGWAETSRQGAGAGGWAETSWQGTGAAYASAQNTAKNRLGILWKNIRAEYVTIALVAANVITYLVLEWLGDTTNGFFMAEHGAMYPDFIRINHEWWRIITAGFLHFGAVHLVNNMVILYCMGSRLERVTGHLKFFLIYLVSLIGAGLLSYGMMLRTGDYAVSAGASGAIFGVIGGFLWIVILHRGRFEQITTRGIMMMIVLTIYYGFSSAGIDNWGHIGGLLAGFAATVILYHRNRQKY
ncbi:rhomboid family intramembrane serine protease [Roseburia hominis]|uniref:Rhomboid family intramembrane serine protease n=1 Tax=Roseburia hominis TaxID=301301 RepID=A0A395V9Q8_9FIRM|nr:rhomboid family intramembrane serine protease [Roseburia hominis]RGS38382.1 rhomboid family intramembrane serine protease [Roseburia hominis]